MKDRRVRNARRKAEMRVESVLEANESGSDAKGSPVIWDIGARDSRLLSNVGGTLSNETLESSVRNGILVHSY